MYLSCLICTKNNHKSADFYYFSRLRQETNKKEDINSSFFFPYYCVVVDFDGVTSKTLRFFKHGSKISLKFMQKSTVWLRKAFSVLNFLYCVKEILESLLLNLAMKLNIVKFVKFIAK